MHYEIVMDFDVFSHSDFFILGWLSWNFKKMGKLGFISSLATKAQLYMETNGFAHRIWYSSKCSKILKNLFKNPEENFYNNNEI